MKFKGKGKASMILTVALGLVFTLLSPVTQSQATGTITKTITVNGTNGQPYAGALVAIAYTDETNYFENLAYSSTVATNSSGVASITIPSSILNAFLLIEPSAGDTSTAIFVDDSVNKKVNQNITVNLLTANTVLNLQLADGTDAPIRTMFYSWVDRSGFPYHALRQGKFGMRISENLVSNSCEEIYLREAYGSNVGISISKSIKKIVSGDSVSFHFYDSLDCTNEISKVNGVINLRFATSNLSGTLQSNAGTAISLSGGSIYRVESRQISGEGVENTEIPRASRDVNSDGSWALNVNTSVVGKYEILFIGSGSDVFPTFGGNYFWITSDGKFSTAADGSNPSSTLSKQITIPIPNLKIHSVDEDGATPRPSDFGLGIVSPSDTNTVDQFVWGGSSSGIFSFKLNDGIYRLSSGRFKADGNWIWLSFDITVTNGLASVVATSSDAVATSTSNTWTISSKPSNIAIQITDSRTANISSGDGYTSLGSVLFCKISNSEEESCQGSSLSASGTISRFLEDGSYKITVTVTASTSFGRKELQAQVSNGIVNVTGITKTGNNWKVSLPDSNIKFKFLSPVDANPLSFGNVDVSSNTDSFNLSYNMRDTLNGELGIFLPDGEYTLTLQPDYYNIKTRDLGQNSVIITVVNGVADVKLNGIELIPTNGIYTVSALSSNFLSTFVDENSSPLQYGMVVYCKQVNGKYIDCKKSQIFNGGLFSASLSDGNWQITIYPPSELTITRRVYSVTVSGGTPSVSGASQTNGRWILTGAMPNVTGAIKAPNGSSMSFVGDQGVSLNLQKYAVDHWEWTADGIWRQVATWGMQVVDAGRYRIVATPQNLNQYVQSYSSEFWVNSSGEVSTTQGGTYASSLANIDVTLAVPNLNFKVISPFDNSALKYGWIEVLKVTNNNQSWVANADIFPENGGLVGVNLTETGEYIIRVNSNKVFGLAPREYRVVASDLTSITMYSGSSSVAKDAQRFIVAPNKANITARIMKADGTPFAQGNNVWANVNVQKYFAEKNYWEWTQIWGQVNEDGYVMLRISDLGKYRLRIEPQGDPASSVTYSEEFTISAGEAETYAKDFGNIALVGPSIKVSVTDSSGTALNWASIEIRKNGQWQEWVSTQGNSIAAISLTSEGTYEFVVYPPADVTNLSRATYVVRAIKNQDGSITALADTGTGVSTSAGITKLQLGLPTLVGTVRDPADASSIAYSQIYAIEKVSGREFWEFSTQSNVNGQWSMSLPEGTYSVIARAPWGTSVYGNSLPVGDVVVNASKVATSVPAGVTASGFKIKLQSPTWSGVVKNPSGTAVIPNAQICLRISFKYNCTSATANGTWALSAPSGFENFASSTDAFLEVIDYNDKTYSALRIEGTSNVQTKIGNSGSGIELRLTNPNTVITVTAGGSPVSNIWVSLDRDQVGWLGGAVTDAEGKARFNISNPSTEFRARVDVGGNSLYSGNYTSTLKTYSAANISSGTTSGTFNAVLALATPNLRVVLHEPRTNGALGPIVSGTWIDLYDVTHNEWAGGSSTDANGQASFTLKVPSGCCTNEYTMTVYPAWNTTSNLTRVSYKLVINSSNVVTVTNLISGAHPGTETVGSNTAFSLTLGIPAITGKVLDSSSNPVADSWVLPTKQVTGEWMGQYSMNSRQDGSFGLSVPDGAYNVEAHVPWNITTQARSSKCPVTVSNGAVTTAAAGCVKSDKSIELALRPPNLSLTLKTDGVAVANANIGFASGKWSTYGHTNQNGEIAVFIDADEIRANSGLTGIQKLYVWVDPPYGSSAITRWDCQSGASKPICSGIPDIPATGDYQTTNLGNVEAVKPNTILHIASGGTALPNSWVTVFAVKTNSKRWLGGANSGMNGDAAFNIDSATVTANGETYLVEVNPSWEKKSEFASREHSVANWSGLNGQTFAPSTPNLKVILRNSDDTAPSRYGNVSVEEVNSNDLNQKWLGWYGLNYDGVVQLLLPSNKRFRLTFNAGWDRKGAQTPCIVSTDSSGTVSRVSGKCDAGGISSGILTMVLDGGNIVGTVTRASDGSVVVGAVVYAFDATTDGTDATTAVIGCTSEAGRYGLQLDATKTWRIKIFPANPAGETALATAMTSTAVTPSNSISTTKNFALDNK